ncbi:hypothetical protein N9948_01810 [bacterium]|nr:hypothetical protein [bacterium]
MYRIKKKQILLYKSNLNVDEVLEVELKVICKEQCGDELVAKCKVMTKGWYTNDVYVTQNDLYSGKLRIL